MSEGFWSSPRLGLWAESRPSPGNWQRSVVPTVQPSSGNGNEAGRGLVFEGPFQRPCWPTGVRRPTRAWRLNRRGFQRVGASYGRSFGAIHHQPEKVKDQGCGRESGDVCVVVRRGISELIGLDVTETSTMAQLWFALQIHEAMEIGGNSATLDTRPQA